MKRSRSVISNAKSARVGMVATALTVVTVAGCTSTTSSSPAGAPSGGGLTSGGSSGPVTAADIAAGLGAYCDSTCKEALVLKADPATISCKVAFLDGTTSNPSDAHLFALFKQDAKKWFPKIDSTALSANGDPQTQANQMDTMSAQGAKVIILGVIDSQAIAPAVKRAEANGVKIVSVDRLVPVSVTTDVEADNFAMGVQEGQFAAKELKGKGNVAVVAGPAAIVEFPQRYQGFLEGIKAYPDMHIVTQQVDNDISTAGAYTITQNLLTRFPEGKLDWIYSMADVMTEGVIKALDGAHRTDVSIGSIDAQSQVLQDVADGHLVKLDIPYPQSILQGLVAAAKTCAGESVPPYIRLSHPEITKENAKQYIGTNF
jgi:ribose transport system substrate-binding protein